MAAYGPNTTRIQLGLTDSQGPTYEPAAHVTQRTKLRKGRRRHTTPNTVFPVDRILPNSRSTDRGNVVGPCPCNLYRPILFSGRFSPFTFYLFILLLVLALDLTPAGESPHDHELRVPQG